MSGWTALTIHAQDEETNEEIEKELNEQYQGRDPYTADGYAERTVQVGRHASHEKVAEEFAEQFPQSEQIVVVSANDTSGSGRGSLFSVDNEGNIEQIDTKQGYEGACGEDVTGYFRQEHGVKSYATWEA